MKIIAKRFILALCVLQFATSAGWCINPFEVNQDGFGPKIKGVQLGMRIPVSSLYELACSEIAKNDVADLIIFQDSGKTNCISISFTLTHNGYFLDYNNVPCYALNDWAFLGMSDYVAPYNNNIHYEYAKQCKEKLDETYDTEDPDPTVPFKMLENNGINRVWVAGSHYMLDWNSKRILYLIFPKSAFLQGGHMTEKEFLQQFINAYHVPTINNIGESQWEYRDVSNGWIIKFDLKKNSNIFYKAAEKKQASDWSNFEDDIVVCPLVTQTAFD